MHRKTYFAFCWENSPTYNRGVLDGQQFPESLSVGIPLQLLSRRPDIRQSEAALAETFYATGEARSYFYPSITLSGTAGWTNNSGISIVNPGKWLFNAVGSLVTTVVQQGNQYRPAEDSQSAARGSLAQLPTSLTQCRSGGERSINHLADIPAEVRVESAGNRPLATCFAQCGTEYESWEHYLLGGADYPTVFTTSRTDCLPRYF